MDLYFPKQSKGKIKVIAYTIPILSKILEKTFLTGEYNVLLDMTDIIKFRNYFFNNKNNFKFDKTIDRYRRENKYLNYNHKFETIENYNNFLRRLIQNLNQNNIIVEEKEEKKIYDNINEFLEGYQSLFYIEQIGMFPILNKMSKSYALLTRFGIRNEFYDWHYDKLEKVEINFDGGKIINDNLEKIIKNYDLDGFEFDKKALKGISDNSTVIKSNEKKKAIL